MPLDHGIAVADGITDSKRMIMEGVGHEIPEELLPEIINEIVRILEELLEINLNTFLYLR